MTAELITRYVKILIVFAALWLGLWAFNAVGCNRVGNEMTPTLNIEKGCLIDPRVRSTDDLKADDLVVYQAEPAGSRESRRITARVVGLPGDKVKIVKGEVFVNGSRAATSVASDRKAQDDYAEIFVPRNTVFVLCDNRGGTTRTLDSRTLGPIGAWALVGRLR
jgi:signal peptidase I